MAQIPGHYGTAMAQAAASGNPLPASASPAPVEELPEWRRELARRLQRIKEKRSQEEPMREIQAPDPTMLFPDLHAKAAGEESAPPQAERLRPSRHRRSARPRFAGTESFLDKVTAEPEVKVEPTAAVMSQEAAAVIGPQVLSAEIVPDTIPPVPDQAAPALQPESDEIKTLIDSVVATQSAPADLPPVIPDFPLTPAVETGNQTMPEGRDRLILLTRTLSGLIDLIVVILCGSACVLGADIFSGIVIVDSASILNYSLLLTTILFLYSLFFLGTANQTIGMMITELRVVGELNERPPIGRILLRCALFLPSALALGIGLIWGFFDSESACLHDKLSGTRVVRFSLPPTLIHE